jgi:hypothetical protein
MNRIALIIAALLCMASRHPDRMIRADLVLNCSYNRGDASDRSWNATNGTLQGGAVVTAGQRHLTLDGSGDFVSHGDSANHSFTDGSGTDRPFSVSLWAFMNDATSFRVLTKTSTVSLSEWAFSTTGGDRLSLALYSGGTTTVNIVQSSDATVTALEGQWVHLGASYSGGETAASIKLFVNGAQIASTGSVAGTYAGMSNTTAPLNVGVLFPAGTPAYANGNADDVRIYNRELSAAEAAAIYSSGRE